MTTLAHQKHLTSSQKPTAAAAKTTGYTAFMAILSSGVLEAEAQLNGRIESPPAPTKSKNGKNK